MENTTLIDKADDRWELSPPPKDMAPLTAAVLSRWIEIEASLRVIPQPLHPDTWLRPVVVSKLLGFSEKTLETWRAEDRGPPVVYIRGRPRYQFAALCRWVAAENNDKLPEANPNVAERRALQAEEDALERCGPTLSRRAVPSPSTEEVEDDAAYKPG